MQIQQLNNYTFSRIYNIYSKIIYIIQNNPNILSDLLDKLELTKPQIIKQYLIKSKFI